MSQNFSPSYGQNPSGVQQPLQTDGSGNLLVNAAVLSPTQSIAINDNTTRSQHWSIDAAGAGAINLTQVNGATVSAANAVPVTPNVTTSATSTLTSVASSATTVSLLASNTNRKGAYFYNDSTAILYLAFAATASTSAYTVQIPSQGFFEMPPSPTYTGAIAGIWASANGNARITELS